MVKVKIVLLILFLTLGISFFSFLSGRAYESLLRYRADETAKLAQQEVTGYDVWDSVNSYREQNQLPKLTLSEELCDNIVGRWEEVHKTYNHDGLDEFVQSQKDSGRWSQNLVVTELIAGGTTGMAILRDWQGSPSHDQLLLDKRFAFGCAYAYDNYALLFMSETE